MKPPYFQYDVTEMKYSPSVSGVSTLKVSMA